MKVGYLVCGDRERYMLDYIALGVAACGDELLPYDMTGDDPDIPVPDADVVIMWGVKSRHRFQAHRAAGYNVVFIDKGHFRDRGRRVRFAANAHQPTGYVMDMQKPRDRWDALKLGLVKPGKGHHVVLALSSQKYCDWYGYGDAHQYALDLARRIRRHTDRPIIYRPKPSWKAARELEGITHCRMSRAPETMDGVLKGASVLVTHGSGACLDALQHGVPVCAVGEAVSRAIGNVPLKQVNDPVFPSQGLRLALFSNLAYCQWTLPEIAGGEAWADVRGRL